MTSDGYIVGGFVEGLEALSWLEQSDGKDRTISEDSETMFTTQEGLNLVRELYSAGAIKVLVQKVEIGDDHEDASGLTVMLPKDPNARAALFAIEARVLVEMDSVFDPAGERGQDCFGLGW